MNPPDLDKLKLSRPPKWEFTIWVSGIGTMETPHGRFIIHKIMVVVYEQKSKIVVSGQPVNKGGMNPSGLSKSYTLGNGYPTYETAPHWLIELISRAGFDINKAVST